MYPFPEILRFAASAVNDIGSVKEPVLVGDKKLPDIINEYRIKRARELLLTTNKSIFEIALDCGFSDAGYFIKIFKSFEKLTPAEFRKKPS